YREHGQGTIEELRNRHFRKELEEREWIDKDKGSSRRAIEPSRESTASSAKKRKLDQVPFASLDALDDEESDSEDDTAALLAELQRIKKARVAEQAKKEMEKGRMENILSRKWDDVVFKNCARSEPKKKHDVFINDSVLSEFHCKFMTKYVK
ncbi:Protein CWC15-like protein A, partial [Acromyrmex echinatior]